MTARHGATTKPDAADHWHCEAYNRLNMKLLGVLQLLYKWVAWAQLADVGQTARRGAAF